MALKPIGPQYSLRHWSNIINMKKTFELERIHLKRINWLDKPIEPSNHFIAEINQYDGICIIFRRYQCLEINIVCSEAVCLFPKIFNPCNTL